MNPAARNPGSVRLSSTANDRTWTPPLVPPVSEALNNFVTSQNDTSEIMSLRVLTQVDLHKAVSAGVAGAPIALEVHLTSWATKRRTFQNERSLQIKAFF